MPSSLRDEALELAPEPYRPKSDVEKLAAVLSPELRAEFVDAVNDHTVNADGLRAALARRGFDISRTSISHFRGTGRRLS